MKFVTETYTHKLNACDICIDGQNLNKTCLEIQTTHWNEIFININSTAKI